MTDQQEQIEQHVAAELQAEQQEQAQEEQQQPAPERSQAEMLRDAMAGNFIEHCVNARVAECQEHGADPRYAGAIDAVTSVIAHVINMAGDEGVDQQFGAVTEALSLLSIGQAPLVQHIVKGVIVKTAAQGTALALLGELQQLAINTMMQKAMEGVYSACMEKVAQGDAAPDPMKPFAPMAESVPAAGDDQGEELPESFKRDAEVARQQVEKGEVQPYTRRTTRTRAKPKSNRRR